MTYYCSFSLSSLVPDRSSALICAIEHDINHSPSYRNPVDSSAKVNFTSRPSRPKRTANPHVQYCQALRIVVDVVEESTDVEGIVYYRIIEILGAERSCWGFCGDEECNPRTPLRSRASSSIAHLHSPHRYREKKHRFFASVTRVLAYVNKPSGST